MSTPPGTHRLSQTEENITPPTPCESVELARQALAKAAPKPKPAAPPKGQDRKPQQPGPQPRRTPTVRRRHPRLAHRTRLAGAGRYRRHLRTLVRIVGERLAEHVRPCSYADGELVVAVDSPAWATQIRAMAQLVRKLNEELGHGAVRVIKVNGPGGYRTSRGQWRVR